MKTNSNLAVINRCHSHTEKKDMNDHFVYRHKKFDKNQPKYVKLVRGTHLLEFLIIVIDNNYKLWLPV